MSAGSQIPLKGDLESSAVSSGLQRCPRADGEGCHRPMRARRARAPRVSAQPLPCTFPDAPSRGGPHEVGQAVREPPAHVRVAAAVRPALVGRGRRAAAAFLGLALVTAFAAAPAAAQHLQPPVVASTPASGSTYYPGETIVVQVRPRSSPWVSITSAASPTLGLNVGGSVKSLSGDLQVRRFSYTYYDTDLRETVTRSRETNVLSSATRCRRGPRHRRGERGGERAGRRQHRRQRRRQLVRRRDLEPEPQQEPQPDARPVRHKVDTPAPSWSGVTAPAVLFYAGGSVNYRLPQVANAAAAHNVSYSVTSARPLRTGYTLNASTATITGSYASALARQNYTLRATDGFNRTADLVFTLEVSADAGIESISITSNPGADKTYGKVAPFGTNDTITVRVDLTHTAHDGPPVEGVSEHPIGSNNPPGVQPLLFHLGLQPLGQARFQLRGAGGRLGRRRHLLPDEPDGRRQGRRPPIPPHRRRH